MSINSTARQDIDLRCVPFPLVGAAIPAVSLDLLERHYEANRAFVESTATTARSKGLDGFHEVIESRPQSSLRMLMLATLFDGTQQSMVGPHDVEQAPELVRDQNYVHGLLGAVLEAFDEVAVPASN